MTNTQVFNPFLPSGEYIPDGEPHVFGDRVYLYGSHDLFNGKNFCLGDYVCYSAKVNDLSNWQYEGVIYKKTQDPNNKRARKDMYAPDVCRGIDNRYYLYYFLGFSGTIAVAVCDTPAGQYQFLDYVHYEDGKLLGKKKGDHFHFDPAVYVENNKVYLYTGFCPVCFPLVWGKHASKKGAMVTMLKPDMVTVDGAPKYLGVECKKSAKATSFLGHEFYEAASMRKIGEKYYFIYSSFLGHELCYAISDSPDKNFYFGGTLVSIGDVGLGQIRNVKDANNFCGNTHGSILKVNERYYVFYHRQTNRHCFSRQACAEEIQLLKDGTFAQAEVTSCGLNGKPLNGTGVYEARIACNLKSPKGGKFYMPYKTFFRPFFTQSDKDGAPNAFQYIANITNGCLVGFKYFLFEDTSKIEMIVKGSFRGEIIVSTTLNPLSVAAKMAVMPSKEWHAVSAAITTGEGQKALYFLFKGKGKLSFKQFQLS